MPNPYFIPIYPTAKLGSILFELCGKALQGHSTFILKILLERFQKEFIEAWGKEAYEEYHKQLSKTIDVQQKEKLEKEKQKQAIREEKLRLKRKSLQLKEKELAIREEKSPKTKLKQDIERYEGLLEKATREGNKKGIRKWANLLEQAKRNLQILEDKH